MKTQLVIVLLLLCSAIVQAQSLTAVQAKAHEGEKATVCGVVASEKTATSSRGVPTFINLDAAYPNQLFTILVWGDDRKNVGDLPDQFGFIPGSFIDAKVRSAVGDNQA